VSGIYVVIKYLLSPFLYVARLAGYKSDVPKRIDAGINRIILPLTENIDEIQKNEVQSNLHVGEYLPALPVTLSDGSKFFLDQFTKTPLLLIFIRGSWCSYSRLHLAEINSYKDDFERAGVKLLAITSYQDQDWWRSKGINIPMIIDKDGSIFKRFGLLVNSWYEFTWGRLLPHEGVFLFGSDGKLLESDVRKINNLLPGQCFLSAKKWLEIIDKHF
jgi:peroxiredoxin